MFVILVAVEASLFVQACLSTPGTYVRWRNCRGGALVGIETGFMGPNYSISTACATANYAFVAAANHIRQNEADVMIVGGSEAPIIPVGLGGFVACRHVPRRT